MRLFNKSPGGNILGQKLTSSSSSLFSKVGKASSTSRFHSGSSSSHSHYNPHLGTGINHNDAGSAYNLQHHSPLEKTPKHTPEGHSPFL
jgi:hypothetical protein